MRISTLWIVDAALWGFAVIVLAVLASLFWLVVVPIW